MPDLILDFTRTGIIQFGRFQQADGSFAPIAFNFLLLPSYPDLMKATAQALAPLLHKSAPDRLLATRPMIPLGTVLAIETGIPLTYPYGEDRDYTAAYTIEGAYDVGHPTTLLTDLLIDGNSEAALIKTAQRVGLQVETILCLFQIGQAQFDQPVRALFDLPSTLETLIEHDYLAPPMRDAVLAWANANR